MKNARITSKIDDKNIVLRLPESDKAKSVREYTFGVAHDYVAISGYDYLQNEDGSTSGISIPVTIQIPIRAFVLGVLPKLNAHKYCQPEHLADREHIEDDKYNTPAKYKKGDKYPGYAWDTVAIREWSSKDREVFLPCERNGMIMPEKLYDVIKDKLHEVRD